jgi:hypothetical protein
MTSSGARRSTAALAVAAILAFVPATGHAVAPTAETLFREGRRLMAAGNTGEACARFAESYALEASSGTLLNLALCHETEGKTATASAEYRAAARLAESQGREDRAAVAGEKAAALEPKLARLTVVGADPPPGLKVTSDVPALDEARLGVAVPVDPGVHRLTAAATGRHPWTVTLEIREGEQRKVEIPTLEMEPRSLPALSGPSLGPTSAVLVVPDAPSGDTNPGRHRSLDLYATAGGGILLAAGTALYGIAYAKYDAAKEACDQGPGCSPSERSDRVSTIDALKYSAIGALVTGSVLVVVSGLHHWLKKGTPLLTATVDPWSEPPSIRAVF